MSDNYKVTSQDIKNQKVRNFALANIWVLLPLMIFLGLLVRSC